MKRFFVWLYVFCSFFVLSSCIETKPPVETNEIYDIIFHSNGGNAIASVSVEAGSALSVTEVPELPGITFMGWFLDEDLTIPFNLLTMPEEDIHLYAKWAFTEYEVTLDWGYDDLKTVQLTNQGYFKPSVHPTREGYDFKGYWLSHNAGITLTEAFNDEQRVEGPITLYVDWVEKKISSGQLDNPVVSVSGTYLEWDVVSNASSYEVIVYVDHEGSQVEYQKEVTTETHYDLIDFESNIYTVAIRAKGDGITTANSSWTHRIIYNRVLGIPTSVEMDYDHNNLYWEDVENAQYYQIEYRLKTESSYHYMDENFHAGISLEGFNPGLYVFKITASAENYVSSIFYYELNYLKLNTVQYVSFNKETWTLSWTLPLYATQTMLDVNGLMFTQDEKEYTLPQDLIQPGESITIKLKSYAPSGDYLASTERFITIHQLETPIITWNQHQITWNEIEGATIYYVSLSNQTDLVSLYDNTYDITFTKEGIHELCVIASSGSTFTLDSECASQSVSVHKVIYQLDHDLLDLVSYVKSGLVLTAPRSFHEGYTIEGFYEDELMTHAFDMTRPITSDQTIYVKQEPKDVSIVFNFQDEVTQNETYVTTYGAKIENKEIPIRDGYRFLGYYLDPEMDDDLFFDHKMNQLMPIDSFSIELYAHWVKQYKLTLIDYLGQGKPKDIIIENGLPTEELVVPTRFGHTFVGYFVIYSMPDTIVFDKDMKPVKKITFTQDISLYSKFAANTYTLKLHDNNGSNDRYIEYTFNKLIDNLSIPTKEGYGFDGYFTEPEGKGTKCFTYEGKSVYQCEVSIITDLYASWILPYNLVIMDGNESKTYDVYYHQRLPYVDKPQKEHSIFYGYYTEEEGKGERYDLNSSFRDNWNQQNDGMLYTYWKHTVTLDFRGGTGLQESFNVFYQGVLPEMDQPLRDGYIFLGYFTEPLGLGEKIYDFDMTSSGTWNYHAGMIIYANWKSVEANIVLNTDITDGLENNTQTLAYGLPYELPVPTKLGYDFIGWYHLDGDDQVMVTDEMGVSLKNSEFKENLELYALLSAKKTVVTFDGYEEPGIFNVDFNSDGGSQVLSQTVTGEIGLDYPSNPYKEGYHFSGWYTERNGQGMLYDFTVEIKKDTTLYAYWIPTSENRIGVETWSKILQFSYYKTSYTFKFTAQYDTYIWLLTTTNIESKNLFYVTIYDDQSGKKVGEFLHDYRNYNIYINTLVEGGRSYTITIGNSRNDYFPTVAVSIDIGRGSNFKDGGKAGLVPATRTLEYDSSFHFPVLESSDTLLFKGWKTMVDGNEVYLTDEFGVGLNPWKSLEDMTVTPICGYERYDITYELNLGTTTVTLPNQYYIGSETFELPILSKHGYTFTGWTKHDVFTGEEIDVTHIEKGSTGDIILKAKFEPITYTIKFVSNGGTAVSDLLVNYMDQIYFPEVTRTGYTLRNWCTDSTLRNSLAEGSTMKGNLTLYADWVVTQYQVRYNMDGGSFVSTPKTSFTYFENTFTLVDAKKTGYTFHGWYNNPEFTGYNITQILKNTNQDQTLYAKFTQNYYRITYKLDNGSKDIYDYNYYKDLIILPSNPTKDGYRFVGWYDENDFETEFTATSMPATNIYLMAKYEKIDYTITFNYDDADTMGIESKVARIDEAYGILPTPTKENHTFEGWYTALEDGMLMTEQTVFNALVDQTLYPRFELIHIVRYTDEGANDIPTQLTLSSSTYNEVEAIQEFTQKGYIILSDDSFISITYNWFFTYGYDMNVADGYHLEAEIVGNFPLYLEIINPSATLWTIRNVDMRQVGELKTYNIPIYTTDQFSVFGGYSLAETETTYYQWYTIRIWAEKHGYTFRNPGQEGSMGLPGEKPTVNRNQPVTAIIRQDILVWLNAFSEFFGYDPVYALDGVIYKNANLWGVLSERDVIGYSLPSSEQFMMAHLYKNDTVSTNGSILKDGRYWAPYNYPSGSTADYNNLVETQKVSCFEQQNTCEVGSYRANDLGLYDMSGNVAELVYHRFNLIKGGSFKTTKFYLTATAEDFASDSYAANHVGFRIMLDLYPNAVAVSMSTVGENRVYDVPTTVSDVFGTAVIGGFQLAQTETTYGVWKSVYQWAIKHGYTFSNNGLGPNQTLADNMPVSHISFLDVIVWLNALSEMNSYKPRYFSGQGTIIKDATNTAYTMGNIIVNNEKGYRLPSSVEWEMAARWTKQTYGDRTILGTSKRWLVGNTLNGHHYYTGGYSEYACYLGTCDLLPKPVKSKKASDLGLYDMSGNVFEYVYNTYVASPTVRGTDIMNRPTYESSLIHHVTFVGYQDISPFVGFRILLD